MTYSSRDSNLLQPSESDLKTNSADSAMDCWACSIKLPNSTIHRISLQELCNCATPNDTKCAFLTAIIVMKTPAGHSFHYLATGLLWQQLLCITALKRP